MEGQAARKGNMQEIVLEKLLEFIMYNFQVERDDINLDRSLIDEGIIDSFGLIEIAEFISEKYGCTIDDDDLNRDNFGSVLKIVNFICRKATS